MQETAKGFRAEIPPMRRKKAIGLLAIAIPFSAIGGYAVLRGAEGVSAALDVFIILVLIGAEGLVLGKEIFGTEVIEWDGSVLRVSNRLFGCSRNREFDIGLMRNVRYGSSEYREGNTYVISDGRIQFDYRGKMISIGGNVNEDQAFAIVERIRNQQAQEQIHAAR